MGGDGEEGGGEEGAAGHHACDFIGVSAGAGLKWRLFGGGIVTQVSALIRGCALVLGCAAAAEYPGTEWLTGSKDGWSASLLDAARTYTRARATSSVFIVQSGKVVDSWGDVALRIETQSVRKSFLSSLYGIHVAEGHIDLGKTVGELGITDKEPALTEMEKQATVLDLLRARSGVYHPVGLETAYMRATQPARGSYVPGEHYITTIGISMCWARSSRRRLGRRFLPSLRSGLRSRSGCRTSGLWMGGTWRVRTRSIRTMCFR